MNIPGCFDASWSAAVAQEPILPHYATKVNLQSPNSAGFTMYCCMDAVGISELLAHTPKLTAFDLFAHSWNNMDIDGQAMIDAAV